MRHPLAITLRQELLRAAFIARHRDVYRRLRAERLRDDGPRSLRPFEQTGSLFVHVPKTAGVAISRALYGQECGAAHRTIDQYRLIYPRRVFRSLFKFAFVREPFDRLRSAYDYLRAGGRDDRDRRIGQTFVRPFADLDSFVLRGLETPQVRSLHHFRPQVSYVCLRGSLAPDVDFVGRYERLEVDFAHVCSALGLDRRLSVENASSKGQAPPALSARAIAVVADVYQADFRSFGYDRGGPR